MQTDRAAEEPKPAPMGRAARTTKDAPVLQAGETLAYQTDLCNEPRLLCEARV
jgi:hypothetical protein